MAEPLMCPLKVVCLNGIYSELPIIHEMRRTQTECRNISRNIVNPREHCYESE